MKRIYFDNNATTQVLLEVREAMLPYLGDRFGNPSSIHHFGEEARWGIEEARQQVASLFHCQPGRLVFTSGGSEANNFAIWSAIQAYPDKKHIISSQVEHASVLRPLHFLKSQGYDIELLPVDTSGALDCDALAAAIRPDTVLVSLMGANNETGVLWPIERIGELCREKGVLYHCDAVQMLGKVSLDLDHLPVDYLSAAGHKIHGPKGIGALYLKRTAPVTPFVMGADQEEGRRAGTENLPGIAGFGKACECAVSAPNDFHKRIAPLRDRLEEGIVRDIPEVMINGKGMPRLANTLNVSFRYCSSAGLIQELDEKGIAVSAHSACQSGDLDPSHVLAAMKVPEEYRHGTLRISLGRLNTLDEVEYLLDILPGIVSKFRQEMAI